VTFRRKHDRYHTKAKPKIKKKTSKTRTSLEKKRFSFLLKKALMVVGVCVFGDALVCELVGKGKEGLGVREEGRGVGAFEGKTEGSTLGCLVGVALGGEKRHTSELPLPV